MDRKRETLYRGGVGTEVGFRIIGKLTVFLELQEFSLRNMTVTTEMVL